MRTIRPQGLTFRITQPHGLRVSYLRMHPSLRNELNRIFTGYHGVFTSRLQDNGCIRQDGMMTSHILALVVAVRGAQRDAVHGGPTSRDELVSARSSLQNA